MPSNYRLMSNKQKNFIVWRLENSLPDLFSKIPKNNSKHPDERANYRRMILDDKLSSLSMTDASTIIDFINKGDEKSVEQIIWGIQGLNN